VKEQGTGRTGEAFGCSAAGAWEETRLLPEGPSEAEEEQGHASPLALLGFFFNQGCLLAKPTPKAEG
jgi:hypothetical protein